MTTREKVAAISEVLKNRFNNLSAKEIIDLSFDILEALEREDPPTHV